MPGAQRNAPAFACTFGGFSPRAREGRGLGYGVVHGGVAVVSIPAPARGATFAQLRTAFAVCGFNPRAREGRDYCMLTDCFLGSNNVTFANPKPAAKSF